MAVSLLVANITYYIITCRIDWEALARKELHMESDLAAACARCVAEGVNRVGERRLMRQGGGSEASKC